MIYYKQILFNDNTLITYRPFYYFYLEPLSALFFSAIFLNERLSFIQIIGAIFIIGGAVIAELSKYLKEKKFESEIEDSTQLSSNK